ncbi:FecR domain-containing protein [Chromobacterium vaccinii]|uniref:FecR family protein n=1 Tax=Chromobacterium vaccinii TaxID=1108595 RepID=UPI003C7698E2
MNKAMLLAVCLAPPLALAGAAPAADSAIWQYRVQAGDTLWSVASQHLLSPGYVPQLQAQNHIVNPYRLSSGSVLNIPYAWVKQDTADATLDEMSGQVAAQGRNGAALDLVRGQRYVSGTRFSTGRDSMLRLRFRDGSMLVLNANTTLTLENQAYYPSTGAIRSQSRLDQGSTGNSVIPNLLMPSRYSIQTPSAVTTVRGTEFRVRSAAADDTAAEVLRGKVNVRDGQQEVDVPAGFGSRGKSDGGQPEALPAAPRLAGLAPRYDFNPPPLRWRADAGEAGYHLALNRAGDGALVQERSGAAPSFYPLLPDNGDYLLTIRAVNAAGLEGFDSSRPLQLHAYPPPPLLLASGPEQQQRGAVLEVRSTADAAHPAWLQVARDADFRQPLYDGRLERPQWQLTLPDQGVWYWRAASIGADGRLGPYGDVQRLEVTGWLMVPDIRPATLAGRRYPLPGLRYTLQLTPLERLAATPFRFAAAQPLWLLRDLPRGRFAVTIHIDDDDGYHAEEQYPSLTLP